MSLKSLSDVMVKLGSTASIHLTKICVCVNDCEKSGNSVKILPLTLLVCTFLEFESNLGSFLVSEGDCYAEAKLTMQMRYPILNMYILRNVVNVNYIFKRAVDFSTLDGCLSSEAQSPISLEEDVLNTFRYAQLQMREQIGVGLRVLSDASPTFHTVKFTIWNSSPQSPRNSHKLSNSCVPLL